jgi:hypothetical protein
VSGTAAVGTAPAPGLAPAGPPPAPPGVPVFPPDFPPTFSPTGGSASGGASGTGTAAAEREGVVSARPGRRRAEDGRDEAGVEPHELEPPSRSEPEREGDTRTETVAEPGVAPAGDERGELQPETSDHRGGAAEEYEAATPPTDMAQARIGEAQIERAQIGYAEIGYADFKHAEPAEGDDRAAVDDVAPEVSPPRPLVPSGPPGPRVIIDEVQVITQGLDATVEVRLAAAGRHAVGVANGPAVDGYVQRMCAIAASSAIDDLLARSGAEPEPGRCYVEHAAVVPFGGCQVAVVVLLLSCEGWVEQLAGSAVVTGDPRQAIVRATLAAVNRRLEALL